MRGKRDNRGLVELDSEFAMGRRRLVELLGSALVVERSGFASEQKKRVDCRGSSSEICRCRRSAPRGAGLCEEVNSTLRTTVK